MYTKARVLLVDDEPDTQQTYKDLLESEGYQVAVASTGEEALQRIDGPRPDVIILDIMLPGKDGIQVARELAQRTETAEIPIVIVTALNSFWIGSGLDEVPGIRRFIYKPCRPRTLLEGIEDAVRYQH